MNMVLTIALVVFFSATASAGSMYQRTFSDGTTVTEFKRDGNVSKITVVYEGALKKSFASRGMFAHYAACQIARFRERSHFIVLAKVANNKSEDEVVVGVSSDASESIDTKGFKKYKGDLPLQELYSYVDMCEKLEPMYENDGL